MSLRGPGQTRRRFFAGSMMIILAIAMLGLTGGQQASAQLELLDLIKKKGGVVTKEDPKKKLPGILSGKKDAAKTAVTPKNLQNLPGKGLPGNLTGRGLPGNLTGKTQTGNLPGANQSGKNLLGKGPDTKGTVLGKGIDPKNTKLGNIGDAKGPLGKAGDLKNAKSTIGNIDHRPPASAAVARAPWQTARSARSRRAPCWAASRSNGSTGRSRPRRRAGPSWPSRR